MGPFSKGFPSIRELEGVFAELCFLLWGVLLARYRPQKTIPFVCRQMTASSSKQDSEEAKAQD